MCTRYIYTYTIYIVMYIYIPPAFHRPTILITSLWHHNAVPILDGGDNPSTVLCSKTRVSPDIHPFLSGDLCHQVHSAREDLTT